MVTLVGGKKEKALTNIHYSTLIKKVVSAFSSITTEPLPPAEASFKLRLARSNLQIMIWIGNTDLKPEN